jgi:hypothetical protein
LAHIALVVEGPGDKGALPIVVRHHLHSQGRYDVRAGLPVTGNGRDKITREGELERFVKLAYSEPGAFGVLVLCDSDRDPACHLGPALTDRLRSSVSHIPSRVCLAVKCFENWIVASAESIDSVEVPAQVADFESFPAMPMVKRWRRPGSYVKPVYQPKYAAALDHELVQTRCPSFARLLRCVDELLGYAPEPPASGS